MIACVFRPTNLTLTQIVYDGNATERLFYTATTGALTVFAGSSGNPSQAVVATTWETCVSVYNGTASYNALNGTQSALISSGTTAFSKQTLFIDGSATQFPMTGMIAEYKMWAGALPDPAAVYTQLSAKYGAMPQ
jgi:hypothetical protein